jgi:hypothetical protein
MSSNYRGFSNPEGHHGDQDHFDMGCPRDGSQSYVMTTTQGFHTYLRTMSMHLGSYAERAALEHVEWRGRTAPRPTLPW